MKKYHPFIVLGGMGIVITSSILLPLYFLVKTSFSQMFTFYIVWFVFLIIGLGMQKKFRQKEDASFQK